MCIPRSFGSACCPSIWVLSIHLPALSWQFWLDQQSLAPFWARDVQCMLCTSEACSALLRACVLVDASVCARLGAKQGVHGEQDLAAQQEAGRALAADRDDLAARLGAQQEQAGATVEALERQVAHLEHKARAPAPPCLLVPGTLAGLPFWVGR